MLNSSEFSFEPYKDYRTISSPDFTSGLSGPLLIGTQISTGKKYLVKHTYPHNAANEFVACWLAGKLDVPTPRAYLLSPNKAFRTPYAVAIEYIDDLQPFPKDAIPQELKQDLIAQFALCLILQLEDMIQMNRTDDHIYSYDFSEGFQMLSLKEVLSARSIDAMADRYIPNLREFKIRARHQDFNIPGLAKEFNLDPDYMKHEMLAVLHRALSITEADIEEMSQGLDKLFPPTVSVYYEECIRAVKEEAIRLTQ